MFQCSICRFEYEEGDTLRVLRCGHAEHAECLDQWLAINKSCPLCQKEIFSPPSSACAPCAAPAVCEEHHSPCAMPMMMETDEHELTAMMTPSVAA